MTKDEIIDLENLFDTIFEEKHFKDYKEFEKRFEEFKKKTGAKYRIKSSVSIGSENKRRKLKPLDKNLKYASATFCCIHFGIYKNRGKGIRPNQSHHATGCESCITISVKKNVLQIKCYKLIHNHILGPDKPKYLKVKNSKTRKIKKEKKSPKKAGKKITETVQVLPLKCEVTDAADNVYAARASDSILTSRVSESNSVLTTLASDSILTSHISVSDGILTSRDSESDGVLTTRVSESDSVLATRVSESDSVLAIRGSDSVLTTCKILPNSCDTVLEPRHKFEAISHITDKIALLISQMKDADFIKMKNICEIFAKKLEKDEIEDVAFCFKENNITDENTPQAPEFQNNFLQNNVHHENIQVVQFQQVPGWHPQWVSHYNTGPGGYF